MAKRELTLECDYKNEAAAQQRFFHLVSAETDLAGKVRLWGYADTQLVLKVHCSRRWTYASDRQQPACRQLHTGMAVHGPASEGHVSDRISHKPDDADEALAVHIRVRLVA